MNQRIIHTSNRCELFREFTFAELAQYDGSLERVAYIAISGIVYDVSKEAAWGDGYNFSFYQ